MGGDHAPDETVRGALLYRDEGGTAELILVGRDEDLRRIIGGARRPGITVRDARDVVAMDEHPASALRRRADTSIGIATSLVKHGEADAVVSAGNTGATMAAALLLLGRIRGIDRPALFGLLPTTTGTTASPATSLRREWRASSTSSWKASATTSSAAHSARSQGSSRCQGSASSEVGWTTTRMSRRRCSASRASRSSPMVARGRT